MVFSNGIISLAAASTVLVAVTGAKVDRLIPLYAIGVFTSFTLSQGGMARHHVRLKEPHWRSGLFINATGAVMSGVVAVIIAVTKFKPAGSVLGAWIVIVLVPIMVYGLTRLNKQYEAEAEELEENAPQAAAAPILRRHVVLVFVDSLDLSAARAIQYARTLMPDELRAVHFDLDPVRTEDLAVAWRRLGLSRLPLDLLECPDRRLARSALDVVAEAVADGETEVTVLLPRRDYRRFWHRLLHDRTADTMAAVISDLPHANVTIVPFHLGRLGVTTPPPKTRRKRAANGAERGADGPEIHVDGAVPIGQIQERQRVRVAGRVHALRVQPWAGQPTLECTIVDGTGRVSIVFLGRRQIAGIEPGTRLVVEGVAGERGGRLVILNPDYELLPPMEAEPPAKKASRK